MERGYRGPAAVSKKGFRKGKAIKGADGWVDMESLADDEDEDETGKKPTDSDDEDDEDEDD
jgi:hypothetical protein